MMWLVVTPIGIVAIYLCRREIMSFFLNELGWVVNHPSFVTLASLFISATGATTTVGGKVKWISYHIGTTKYSLPLPYSRTQRPVNITILYVEADGTHREEPINYPQGIPFFCTASQLKCECITIKYNDGNVRSFSGDDEVLLQ